MKRFASKCAMIGLVLFLAACESAEERAERYYQSGLALLDEGDVDRALIEFRNVFVSNPRHIDARMAYADAQRERGQTGDAYGQYVSVIELEPEHPDALIALSEIATISASWEEAQTYGRAAAAVAPDDINVSIVNAMLDYRAAVVEEGDAFAPAARAKAALANQPDSFIARKVVIDHALMQQDTVAALEALEAGLDIAPEQSEYHLLRIGVLNAMDDTAGIQNALEQMAAQFPDNEKVQQELVGWYITQKDLSAAEAYLRSIADRPDASETQKITVVDFLRQTSGVKAAQTELERLVETETENLGFRVILTTLVFAQGDRGRAVSELREIVSATDESDQQRDYQIILAEMLETTADEEKARSLVASVLEGDPGHVDALKMNARWAIAADDPNAAINILRQALAQEPRDVGLIALLAKAHERAGDHDLAGERYASAVEVSGQAPGPSLQHAQYLLDRDRVGPAEAVVTSALRIAPRNHDLLSQMADIHLRQGNWNQVTRVIWRLRSLDTPQTSASADRIQIELMNRQQRFADTSALLERIINSGNDNVAAKAQLIEAQVREGRLDDARVYLDEALTATPNEPTLRFIDADLKVLEGREDQAEQAYFTLIADMPDSEYVLGRLYGLLAAQDRFAEADAVLDTVLNQVPDAPMANLIKASRLEELGNIDGAIAIYEDLYARDDENIVLANNLASLIATHRDDKDSVDRAYAIAARLKGTTVPQFQDTLGWIAYRRGALEEAISHLEPAAAALADDPLTQYHLGMAYMALERVEDARVAFERAVKMGEDSALSQIAEAKRLLSDM